METIEPNTDTRAIVARFLRAHRDAAPTSAAARARIARHLAAKRAHAARTGAHYLPKAPCVPRGWDATARALPADCWEAYGGSGAGPAPDRERFGSD